MIPIRIEWVGVEPMPSPRPRSTSGHTYMPTDYVQYRDALSLMMIQARAKASHQQGFHFPVGLHCQFARSSKRKVDIDNLVKTVMDAGNGGVLWDDDALIHRLSAELVLGADMPGTTVEAYELEETFLLGSDGSRLAHSRAPTGSSRHLHAAAPDSTPEGAETLTEPDSEGDESNA